MDNSVVFGILIIVAICAAWFLAIAYYAFKGIERALWAINTQLDQISKGGERGALQPPKSEPTIDTTGAKHISLSAFGR